MEIVLLGDSIFDNALYVGAKESVSDILNENEELEVNLLAVDGDVTTDVMRQLGQFPEKNTLTFVSCGGNDALRSIAILEEPAGTVGLALEKLAVVRDQFRLNYRAMLSAILGKTENLIVCSIYNCVPGLSDSAQTALALFNEVIFQEAIAHNLSMIDLRLVCDEEADYAEVSPIEPSYQGGQKIATVIEKVVLDRASEERKHMRVYK